LRSKSVYWTNIHGEILVLDKNTKDLRLSSILLLYEVYGYMFFASRSMVVQCQDGMLCIAFLHVWEHPSVRVLIQAEGSDEWVQEKSIQLSLIPEVQERMLMKIVSVTFFHSKCQLVLFGVAFLALAEPSRSKFKFHSHLSLVPLESKK
jgi:hypothetical protein